MDATSLSTSRRTPRALSCVARVSAAAAVPLAAQTVAVPDSVTPEAAADPVFRHAPASFPTLQWHGDTYDLPANAKMLAYNDLYPQAFRIGSAVGLQFHLEVNRPMIESWIREYKAEIEAEKIDENDILPAQGDLEELSKRCRTVYSNFTKVLK